MFRKLENTEPGALALPLQMFSQVVVETLSNLRGVFAGQLILFSTPLPSHHLAHSISSSLHNKSCSSHSCQPGPWEKHLPVLNAKAAAGKEATGPFCGSAVIILACGVPLASGINNSVSEARELAC